MRQGRRSLFVQSTQVGGAMKKQTKSQLQWKAKVSWEPFPAAISTPVFTPIATAKRPRISLLLVYWLSKAFGIAPVFYNTSSEKLERSWQNTVYRYE